MDRFMQWLQREGNRQVPTLPMILATVATAPFGYAIMQAALAWTTGSSGPGLEAFAGATAILWVAWAPMIVRNHQTRRHLRIDPKGFVGSVNRWQEKLAPHAAELEQAAIDLEQIEALAERTSLDKGQSKRLIRLSNDRVRRMFELTVAAPARHGLTVDRAEVQIAEDARWIGEVRRLVERVIESAQPQLEDGMLGELRALADAREQAVAELRA